MYKKINILFAIFLIIFSIFFYIFTDKLNNKLYFLYLKNDVEHINFKNKNKLIYDVIMITSYNKYLNSITNLYKKKYKISININKNIYYLFFKNPILYTRIMYNDNINLYLIIKYKKYYINIIYNNPIINIFLKNSIYIFINTNHILKTFLKKNSNNIYSNYSINYITINTINNIANTIISDKNDMILFFNNII